VTLLRGRGARLDVATTGVDLTIVRAKKKEPRPFYTDVCGYSKALNAPKAAAATTAAGGGSSSVQHRRTASGCRWGAGGGGASAQSAVPNRSVGDTGGGSCHAPPSPPRIESRRRPSMCVKKKRSSVCGGPPSAAQQPLESPGRGVRAWTGRRRSPALQMAWLTRYRPVDCLRNQTRQARASATPDGRSVLYSAGVV